MQSSTMINRRHTIDPYYFDNIDTQEKAYWLGFVWADGNIAKTSRRSSGPNRMRIAQKWSERHHIERLKTALSCDSIIKKISHDGGHDVAQLDINCRPLCAALERLGYDVKAKRIRIPPIPNHLIRHFVRGYFDGDGCLSIYTQQVRQWTICKQEWSLTGQKELMSEIKDTLTANAGTTPTVKLKGYKRSPDVASLRYGKKSDVVKLYGYLYEKATVYLPSKHLKFVEFFSRIAS